MIHTQVAIVGGGPAGLSAALELARLGAGVMVFDENDRPGGQLFKQLHKFFGSGRHGAGVRGFKLGENLLAQCAEHKVDIWLDSVVYGLFPGGQLGVVRGGKNHLIQADKILVCTGATEKPLAFPGWDLPGVMGAGAAQTMININRVLPGKRILMVGSGNVGLVVSYQLLQAGAQVVGLLEGLPKMTGYAVHANKLMRKGVPIHLSHTILEARGDGQVEEAVIAEVGPGFVPVPGTEKTIAVDTICLAVGLTPSVELLRMADVAFVHQKAMGGYVPAHSEGLRTSNPDIYVAGDVAGIEEASTAMEEGRLAAVSLAQDLGLIDGETAKTMTAEARDRVAELRIGSHGETRRAAKEEIVRGYHTWQEQKHSAG